MATTLHTCSGSDENWSDCDRAGCQTNAYYAIENGLCPDDKCTINTMRPFRVTHTQNGQRINTKFEQEGRSAEFQSCNDPDYISLMDEQAFDGSVFTASLWGKF